MKAVIQKVDEAYVKINGNIKSKINAGLLILLGITHEDKEEDIEWLCSKIVNLRIFNDPQDKMNYSVKDCKGEILVISQFTLYANTKKGNRPSYIAAAPAQQANPLYNMFLQKLEVALGSPVGSGEFGADMKVGLINNGPVTIIIDTKDKN